MIKVKVSKAYHLLNLDHVKHTLMQEGGRFVSVQVSACNYLYIGYDLGNMDLGGI